MSAEGNICQTLQLNVTHHIYAADSVKIGNLLYFLVDTVDADDNEMPSTLISFDTTARQPRHYSTTEDLI